MSGLSDAGIVGAIQQGLISIEPFLPELVQPASYDVRLGTHVKVYLLDPIKILVLDPWEDNSNLMRDIAIPDSGWILRPGQFCIGETIEVVGLSESVRAKFEGKSSLGRLGLSTHITAGFIDPGFRGSLTLELKNETELSIRLHTGMKIGQISYTLLMSPATLPYGHPDRNSKYQGQRGATPSRMWREHLTDSLEASPRAQPV